MKTALEFTVRAGGGAWPAQRNDAAGVRGTSNLPAVLALALPPDPPTVPSRWF